MARRWAGVRDGSSVTAQWSANQVRELMAHTWDHPGATHRPDQHKRRRDRGPGQDPTVSRGCSREIVDRTGGHPRFRGFSLFRDAPKPRFPHGLIRRTFKPGAFGGQR